jgi:hypothetical protein
MSFSTEAVSRAPSLQTGLVAVNQPDIGSMGFGRPVQMKDPKSCELIARTDKVAAERREDLVKSASTCDCDCCGLHTWCQGAPAMAAFTVFCFWNPCCWYCLYKGWEEAC